MPLKWSPVSLVVALAVLLGGCATRPINAPIRQASPSSGYQYQARERTSKPHDNLVILAFSGGGTRAAAFSYGVLETLRRTEVRGPRETARLLDEVNVITGVSGGTFTALAYGLYGDKLFDQYEKRFLKRDVQGELIARWLNPTKWPALSSPDWGRSELAAQLYDEILFNGATFADLDRGNGPLVSVMATDISTGSRFVFDQAFFDIICSDLDTVPLSRAAAASSAVPVVLTPVTINNYGGTCNYRVPAWARQFTNAATTPRPAARALKRLHELQSFTDSVQRPYIHLVDGGISDNLGLRGVLDILETFEALHSLGRPTPLDEVRRIGIFVVNSRSSPKTTWDASERAPGVVSLLVRASDVPIDAYSSDTVELLKDIKARWEALRTIRDSATLTAARGDDPFFSEVRNAPDAALYVVDVSFDALDDPKEVEYLQNLPTSLVLPDEAVDRLRAAANRIVLGSPEFQRLLRDAGASVTSGYPTAAGSTPATSASRN